MTGRPKHTVEDLAVFGGVPAFVEPLHVGRPNIVYPDRFLHRLQQILDDRWLTNDGPFVREFEAAIGRHLGVKNCVAVANATLGLELVVKALNLQREVVVPSFTFVATAHALLWAGAQPVFCDVDARTHCVDPETVSAALSDRTAAIVGVHLWGQSCDVDGLQAVADRRKVPLLFDAAHAFGCSSKGRMLGRFGQAEIFSFHATKFLNSFEGGVVTTNDDDLATRLRLMRNFGFSGFDRVECAGTNAKMSEPAAAMGLTSLEALDDIVAVNRRNHARYEQEMGGLPGLRLLSHRECDGSNYQYVVATIDGRRTGVSRDAILRVLEAENILARRYFYPGCHRMAPYREDPRWREIALPGTEELTKRVLVLPTGLAVSEDDVAVIASIVRLALDNPERVSRHMRGSVENTGNVELL